jgi:hypothetical protein
MKLNENPIMVVLGFVFATIGVVSFLGYRLFPATGDVAIAMLALAAVIIFLVLFGKVKENVGMLVIALWLILQGVMKMFGLQFPYSDLLLSGLPVVSGFFLLLGL